MQAREAVPRDENDLATRLPGGRTEIEVNVSGPSQPFREAGARCARGIDPTR